jgi:ABC-type amino acid transport substrate-binding protein
VARRRSVLGIVAVVVVLAAAAFAASRLLAPQPPSGDALTRLRAAGTVRIAVPDAAPQATSAGGAPAGFDVDVARAIATELRLGPTIVPVAPDAAPPDDADLSLGPAGADEGAVTTDVPYAWWPTLLAVPAGHASFTTDDLAGVRVCAPLESQAAAWAADWKMTVVEGAGDDACLAALAAGRADAMLTVALFPAQLAARALAQVVLPTDAAPPPEPRVVRIKGPAADTATLVAEVRHAVDALRAAGRLAGLSRADLGGQDITVAPR